MKFGLLGLLVLFCAFATGLAYRQVSAQPTRNASLALGAMDATAKSVVKNAQQQALQGARYDASYVKIAYPNGDVPPTQGACTDVIVRAFRHAGYDLQKLIHEDMKKSPRDYPRRGKKLDTNIDHRRVPNQVVFFKKFGKMLTNSVSGNALNQWRAGDIVCWKLSNNLDHTGIISDRIGASGMPMVIHNIAGCTEEDCLTEWRIVGHYRYPR
jgi:uncharacterized protein